MVHTSLGTHLLHLRLTDAIRELSGVAGERVHRSWWVSRAGVLRADRASRTWRIRLRSGADALVSRKELPKLKRGGWLDAPEGAGQ